LTSRCNHDCSYCYASRSDKELGLEELGGIFTRAKSWGTKGIVLCGGEPTLRREFDKAVRKKDLNIDGLDFYIDLVQTHSKKNFLKFIKIN
ncbi:MAG: radical SAM protein, partial [Candidatus Aenigmarchaeota archaeon]|nr:radical SAM protein [Candidatus Aenigmarchaeota archaeon]